MDDIDEDHRILGHHLKLWADRYGVIGETKGGAISLEHRWFIVTSQYKIEHIWRESQETVAALLRRFEVINLDEVTELVPDLITKFQ